MGKLFDKKNELADYDYRVPSAAIALKPAAPRDAAKLLVYERRHKKTTDDVFRNLGNFLPDKSVLVMNDTKVIPARLRVMKPTGGRVELLYLRTVKGLVEALADRRLEVGWKLALPIRGYARVVKKTNSIYLLRLSISGAAWQKLLATSGTTPLPPYLRHSPLTEAERRLYYQTVFAKKAGSVAAPTASLHFTPRLITNLKKQGIEMDYVTLHVGLGTFAPLTKEHLKSGRLHTEHYEISKAAAARLNKWKSEGRSIIAVGTTVARALESASRRGRLQPGAQDTNIFIRPGYKWKFVDGLITNFHVPQSSLMMLVAALIGRPELLRTYRRALRNKYKFFSFGDGMLIK